MTVFMIFANYGEASQPYELVYGCKTTVIPDSAKIIGFMAFTDLKTLTKLNIPDDVKVNDAAFNECDNLTSITWKGTEYKSVKEFLKHTIPVCMMTMMMTMLSRIVKQA